MFSVCQQINCEMCHILQFSSKVAFYPIKLFLSPFCWSCQLLAQLLGVDTSCDSVLKRHEILHGGHAYQKVCFWRHCLNLSPRVCISFQEELCLPPILLRPQAAGTVSFLVSITLTCFNEEEFGLPWQGWDSSTCKREHQIFQEHLFPIGAKDTPLFSMRKHAYHLKSEAYWIDVVLRTKNAKGHMVVNFVKRIKIAVVTTYFKKKVECKVNYKSGERFTKVNYILCRIVKREDTARWCQGRM